jgi:hypothetical protein
MRYSDFHALYRSHFAVKLDCRDFESLIKADRVQPSSFGVSDYWKRHLVNAHLETAGQMATL